MGKSFHTFIFEAADAYFRMMAVTPTTGLDHSGNQELFRLSFEHAPVGMALVGPDRRLQLVNARLCRLLGRRAADLIGMSLDALGHPDDVVNGRHLVTQVFDARLESYQAETRYLRDDGTIVATRVTMRRVGDGALAFVEDLGPQKIAEAREQSAVATSAALAELAAKINASLDLDTVLQRVVDGGRHLTAAEMAWIALREGDVCVFKYKSGHRSGAWESTVMRPGTGMGGQAMLTRRPVRTEDYPNDPRFSRDYMAVVEAEGIVAQLVVPIVHADEVIGLFYVCNRTRRPFTERDEAVCVALADHAAIAIRNSGLFESERRSRAVAESANRAKDEFLALVSHELRTPLTPILGWATSLRRGSVAPSARDHALEVIERNARLQARLIDDLLDVSRIVTGKLALDRRPLRLATVVDAAVEAARSSAETKTIRLELRVRASHTVVGDSARLQQVIGNLVANAVKFTDAGGAVTVRLDGVGGEALVTVQDTGCGIAPEMLTRIFDRFCQGDSSPVSGGLGLGLTIARYLVEAHGGTIAAHSEGRGRGSTFTVRLPLAPPSLALAEPEATDFVRDATKLAQTRVIVVEDNADAAELFATILRAAGAEVALAGSVDEALALLAATEPDVVVSDVRMPGRDGLELVRQIRRLGGRRGYVRAIAVTADASADHRDAALRAGFDAHLAKPVDPRALLEAVAAVLAR